MSRLWIKPYDLNLEGVKRDSHGKIISGWVINGGWFFEIKDGEVLCRRGKGGQIVNRFPSKDELVEVDGPTYGSK